MSQTQDYRIFVGAFPQGDLANHIQAVRTQFDPVTARITAPHVTLAGTYWRSGPATPENEAATIARLHASQGEFQPFALSIGGIATFPPADRPVIYLQVATTPALLSVRSALLKLLGRDKHRHFTPHLTLAMRLKGTPARQMVEQLQQSEWQTGRWSAPIERLTLMQRGPDDPAWRELASVLLGDPGQGKTVTE